MGEDAQLDAVDVTFILMWQWFVRASQDDDPEVKLSSLRMLRGIAEDVVSFRGRTLLAKPGSGRPRKPEAALKDRQLKRRGKEERAAKKT